jgi:hypothetical protein
MHNIDEKIQARIDKIYEDIKPLQEFYGIKSRTIEERYEDYKRKQEILNSVPKPRFKLPKL